MDFDIESVLKIQFFGFLELDLVGRSIIHPIQNPEKVDFLILNLIKLKLSCRGQIDENSTETPQDETSNDAEDQELVAYRNKIVTETLKNIVMHVVPTTRKAYVDDIVNGIRTLMTGDELAQVSAPLDLPDNVLRFVQKRYNNLLLEESYATTLQPSIIANATATTKSSTTGTSHVHVECDPSRLTSSGALPVKITVTMSPKNQQQQQQLDLSTCNVTAEVVETNVTVVKEIRKEMLTAVDDAIMTSTMSSETTSGRTASRTVNEEIMKVDEETLYIVEKRKQPTSDSSLSTSVSTHTTTTTNQLASSSATTGPNAAGSVSLVTGGTNPLTNNTGTQSAHFVEKEIRKNFELKSKEQVATNDHPTSSSSHIENRQHQQSQSKQLTSASGNFYDEFNK
jgi:hypothetical protein